MGYTTDFTGEFHLDHSLTPEHKAYLIAFARTRRMKRNSELTEKMPDPIRKAIGLPIGPEGAYYVGSDKDGNCGQSRTDDILDYNAPPGQIGYDPKIPFLKRMSKNRERTEKGTCQPGLWCQWAPNEDGTSIIWDGGEKFYEYVPWIVYLIKNFLEPWGYILNGIVEWQGEENEDSGVISIKNNTVHVYPGG